MNYPKGAVLPESFQYGFIVGKDPKMPIFRNPKPNRTQLGSDEVLLIFLDWCRSNRKLAGNITSWQGKYLKESMNKTDSDSTQRQLEVLR
jgi:hypothetical protein